MSIHFKIIKLNYKIILSFLILIFLSTAIFVYTDVKAYEQEGIRLPIIMYHSILKSKKDTYIVTPDQLEDDLKYIKEQGYTTITMADLIEYVYDDKPLPEKPIMITFDDGYYNNIVYAVPLLRKYDMKAVISIFGRSSDESTQKNETNANYGYLRWEDINSLIEEGVIEFQNHSYNLHSTSGNRRGSLKKKRRILRKI